MYAYMHAAATELYMATQQYHPTEHYHSAFIHEYALKFILIYMLQ
jgi:hypothetical protein